MGHSGVFRVQACDDASGKPFRRLSDSPGTFRRPGIPIYIRWSETIAGVELPGEPLHVPFELGVGDGGVNLRGADVPMAQQLADGLDGDTLRQRDRRGERVARDKVIGRTIPASGSSRRRQALHQPLLGRAKIGSSAASVRYLDRMAFGTAKSLTYTSEPVLRRVVPIQSCPCV